MGSKHALHRGMLLSGQYLFVLMIALCTGDMGCTTSGSQGPQGDPGPAGQDGAQGPPGLACWDTNGNGSGDTDEDANRDGLFDARDCQVDPRIYGDGSAGALTISSDTLWTGGAATPPPGNNTQFTDFVVNAGVTLRIPSGIVIRCTGTFINNGTIIVNPGAAAALVDVNASTNPNDVHTTNYRQPGQGIALCLPSPGEYATPGIGAPESGFGGCGIDNAFAASFLINPGIGGGGGGAADFTDLLAGVGGDGGGTLVVRARGAIINEGFIRADGDIGQSFGGGGGGGGVVIVASHTSITSNAAAASISAKGGAGGESNATRGPGGGGGGGIVHLIAPTISVDHVDVAGGAGGNVFGNITANPHQAGAGGGGSFGTGGNGGNGVLTIPTPPGLALTAGSGILLQSLADPATLF